MSLPAFKPSQRRLLVGSTIALALFATPYSYDFSHHQWQVNQARPMPSPVSWPAPAS